MLLEILSTLESLAADITLVWFKRDMHSNMGGDVIPFYGGGAAAAPLAGQVQVVAALATDMAFADVFLGWVSDAEMTTRRWMTYIEGFCGWALLRASLPETQ